MRTPRTPPSRFGSRATPAELALRKGDRTRARILEAAANLFAERGYAAVGLQELGSACKLTKSALFKHFETKREIYVASVAHAYSSALDPYEPMSISKPPKQRLHHYLTWICAVMSSNRLVGRLALRMFLDRDLSLARALLPGSFGRTHELFLELLGQVHPRKDARVLAMFVYSILILNDEMLDFANLWMPETASIVGGVKSAAWVEAMIGAW
jgi:AcrR family transcriptional regulator